MQTTPHTVQAAGPGSAHAYLSMALAHDWYDSEGGHTPLVWSSRGISPLRC